MHVIICTHSQSVIDAVGRSIPSRATVCESGMELLAAVRALAADLVVLDLETPGMNGLLLVSAVQELQPRLPILAVSGRARDVRALLQKGVRYVALGDGLLQPMLAEMTRQVAAEAPAR